jgi:hypothetical protein
VNDLGLRPELSPTEASPLAPIPASNFSCASRALCGTSSVTVGSAILTSPWRLPTG